MTPYNIKSIILNTVNTEFSYIRQNTNHFAFSLIKRGTDHTVVQNHSPFVSLNTLICGAIIVPGTPLLKIKAKVTALYDKICHLLSRLSQIL